MNVLYISYAVVVILQYLGWRQHKKKTKYYDGSMYSANSTMGRSGNINPEHGEVMYKIQSDGKMTYIHPATLATTLKTISLVNVNGSNFNPTYFH